MTQLIITSITGLTIPYFGYACDVYGNQCQPLGIITTVPTTITLPSQFDMAPAIGLKLTDTNGCEKFSILICDDDFAIKKQFQDYEDFLFMDYEIYKFQ
jgi:hypothetical protein